MFFPKDKQNVPVTVRLLKALAGLVDPSMNNAVQPTMLPQLIRARRIGHAMQGLLAPLINLNSSISELLVLISMAAHILFVLFRAPGAGTKLMQSVRTAKLLCKHTGMLLKSSLVVKSKTTTSISRALMQGNPCLVICAPSPTTEIST